MSGNRWLGAALRMSILLGAATPDLAAAPTGDPPNVLLIIADDLGVDRVGAYAAHPDPGRTPVIDQLATEGVLFRNAYSDPLCSPTRATMLTGRYGYRTGMTDALNWELSLRELPLSEITIPEALPEVYRSAAIGKWHLTTADLSGPLHPLLQGFDHHAGTLSNIDPPESYFEFTKSVDGVPTRVAEYATTDTVNDALAWIRDTPEPWFVWLAFNAPHSPWHKPPAELHGYDLPGPVSADIPLHTKAAIEAMDTEIGRLLGGIEPEVLAETIIVFVGDNGTAGPATSAPFDPQHAKGKVYEGGVHVPLIVKGPGVAVGAASHALVHTSDLFATVLELAGGDASSGVDSVSFVPHLSQPTLPSQRSHVYTGLYAPLGYYPGDKHLRSVRERRFKLLHQRHDLIGLDQVEMYDLVADPLELNDLLAGPLSPQAQVAHDQLQALLDQHLPPWELLDGGIPGPFGDVVLRGDGALLPNEDFTVTLRRAPPNSTTLLAFALALLDAPLYGGNLVPDITFAVSGVSAMTSDATGGIDLGGRWPAGVPGDLHLYMQFWVVDASAPFGWSASNGLAAVAP